MLDRQIPKNLPIFERKYRSTIEARKADQELLPPRFAKIRSLTENSGVKDLGVEIFCDRDEIELLEESLLNADTLILRRYDGCGNVVEIIESTNNKIKLNKCKGEGEYDPNCPFFDSTVDYMFGLSIIKITRPDHRHNAIGCFPDASAGQLPSNN